MTIRLRSVPHHGYGLAAEALAEIATRIAQGSVEAVGHVRRGRSSSHGTFWKQ